MRIGLYISPAHAVPPDEKNILAPWILIGQLADGFLAKGHTVTLFAAKRSSTQAKLVHGGIEPTVSTRSAYADADLYRSFVIAQELSLMREVISHAKAKKLDIVHIHQPVERLYPALLAMPSNVPVVITFHDPITPERFPALEKLAALGNIHFVSLSKSQQQRVPFRFAGMVPNGVDTKLFCPDELGNTGRKTRGVAGVGGPPPAGVPPVGGRGGKPLTGPVESFAVGKDHRPLLITGRIVPQKGFSDAIEAARATHERLLIVGQEYEEKQEAKAYFEHDVQPFIDGKTVLWESVVKQEHLVGHYQTAKALLFPIHWEEPFGLVMIEAMSCGTPVVAYNKGSVPEIVVDQKTGFIVDHSKGVAGLVAVIKRIGDIDRQACRNHVQKHFSLDTMIAGYERVYAKLCRP